MQNTFAKISAVLIAIILSLPVFAQTSQELFDLGTRAYKQADFKQAATYFEESAEKGFGAAAYHNAANAYAKMSQNGLAILNYEKARYLKPRSPETIANLALLNKMVGTQEKERNIIDIIFGELSNAEWVMLAISTFWLGVIIIASSIFLRKNNTFLRLSFCGLVMIFAISIAGSIYWSELRNTAISVSQDALIKLSPTKNAPAIASFPEGKRAIIKERRGNYLRIQTPDKKIGWISLSNVARVEFP